MLIQLTTISLFFILAISAHTQDIQQTNQRFPKYIDSSLPCEQSSAFFNIPIPKQSAGNMLSIKMSLYNSKALPVAMAVYDSLDQLGFFDRHQIYSNDNIDIDSIQLGKSVQNLYYQTQSNQTSFIIAVYRLSLHKLTNLANTDRFLQSQNRESDIDQISKCIMSVQFSLQINQMEYTAFEMDTTIESGIITPPFRNYECSHGSYNSATGSCYCKIGYAMDLCDIPVSQITNKRDQVQGRLAPDTKRYFYYESQAGSGGEETIQLKLVGKTADNFTVANPQLHLLWLRQRINERIRVPTIFNQQNPEEINKIVLKSGQRLVLCVYRPFWSTQQTFLMEINSYFTQAAIKYGIGFGILIFILSICCCICCRPCCHIKKYSYSQSTSEQSQFPEPIPIYSLIGIIFNQQIRKQRKRIELFDIYKNFPTVAFHELYELLSKIQNLDFKPEENPCSICLQPYEGESNNKIKMTYCCHIFHSQCIRSWWWKNNNCPNCRTEFKNSKMNEIMRETGIKDMEQDKLLNYLKIWKHVKKIDIVDPNEKQEDSNSETARNIRPTSQNQLQ